MEEKLHLYFKNSQEWRDWLHENHQSSKGVYLIFYRVNSGFESMRWEEAVQVALCYGWIDSIVRKMDDDRRKQAFGPRKENSTWSKVNKIYVEKLILENVMHESGLKKIETAKQNGSWELLDNVENLIIPEDLQKAFDNNPPAFHNYKNFSFHYQKSYLYWLNQAKREETRNSRIGEIIRLCNNNCKTRH